MAAEKSKKRGPVGLASAKAKKQKKVDAHEDKQDKPMEGELAPGTQTVALPDDIEEDDEIGQLSALYLTAVELLNKRNVSAARPILNGTIHEADRILRNAPDVSKLSYEFHRVYAAALLDLSLLVDDAEAQEKEKAEDFISAALDRCETGLENGIEQGRHALKLTQARCICRQVQHRLTDTSPDLKSNLVQIRTAMKLIDAAFKESLYMPLQLNQALEVIQDFADSLLEIDAGSHKAINQWAESIWTKVLAEQQENVSALEGCGRVWLSLAQPNLVVLEESDDAAEQGQATEAARSALETSVELLNQAVKCAEQAKLVTGDLLCLLAEATISLANTFEDGPHYDQLEKDTMSLIRRADAMEDFELPARFRDMLDENTDNEPA